MKHLLVKLYNSIPSSFRNYIGSISFLSGIRNLFLKQHEIYREACAFVTRSYENYRVNFEFYGSIKVVAKASRRGIENKLLTNSIKLIDTYTTHQQDCVILDIGANFGFLSLVWANSICNKSGKIFAFEPNPNVYKSFLKSISKNDLITIIKAEQKAIGSKNKSIEFFLDNTTSNIKRNTKENKTIQVEMITIDSYVVKNGMNRCDLIKIDVDGIELEILKGSIQTLLLFKPIFIVETNNDKRIVDFFKKFDYRILDMTLESYSPDNMLPPNIFCIPN